jgi:hypothetical protein
MPIQISDPPTKRTSDVFQIPGVRIISAFIFHIPFNLEHPALVEGKIKKSPPKPQKPKERRASAAPCSARRFHVTTIRRGTLPRLKRVTPQD